MKQSQAVESLTETSSATYQDVLDAPPHMVAEIIDGKLYTHPRPAPPLAVQGLGIVLVHLLISVMADPVAGGSLTNRNFIWETIYWCQTSQDGDASECLILRLPLTSSWLQTGYAKYFPHRLEILTSTASFRFTPARVLAIFGW